VTYVNSGAKDFGSATDKQTTSLYIRRWMSQGRELAHNALQRISLDSVVTIPTLESVLMVWNWKTNSRNWVCAFGLAKWT
jgi:hypothetical protein